MRRVTLALFFLLLPLTAGAQSDGGGIDVIDVSGPLDPLALDFMRSSIEDAAATGQELAVLQINSRAALDREAFEELAAVLENPPLPVAVWVGPAPAVAFGGAAALVLKSPVSAIAPGSEIGLVNPLIAGDTGGVSDAGPFTDVVTAEDSGLDLQPTIRQYLQELNGVTFETVDGPVVVETIEEFTQDGEAGVTVKETTFIKPGVGVRFFRLGASPEAAFFFLMVGLTIISFEFFAIGPGVAAGVAAVSLLIAGWGIANLPVQWWALALGVAGWGLLTASYQRGGVLSMTLFGAVLLQIAGMGFIDGSGQIDPRWYLVLPTVFAVLFFFLLAMPTVQRARFSTQVLGRESLVGANGVALSELNPDGIVEVNGARWQATAHREAGIITGMEVVVTGVDGLFLEVEPKPDSRENSAKT